MKKNLTREMVLAGFMVALGILIPVVFHAFGAGPVFLPMHIPVLLAGFYLGLPFALAAGMLTPFLSSVLTGMPPMMPIMPVMVFELGVYAIAASIFYRKLKFNIYVALIASMATGRLMAGLVVLVMTGLFSVKMPAPVPYLTSAVVTGIPGMIIQVAVIPVIVMITEKNSGTKGVKIH